MNLAFVPIQDVEVALKYLESSFEDEELVETSDYFAEKYIRKVIRRKRRAPRFGVVKWKGFDRIGKQHNTMNNPVEAINNVKTSHNANCKCPGLHPIIKL